MANKIFKKILAICFEEDYPELHRELISLEIDVKKQKDYIKGIEGILGVISLYTEDFPEDIIEQIEMLYEDYLNSLDF